MSDIQVLILAGQRQGIVDPLCEMTGVERKAIIPIAGKPMIFYPLDALIAGGMQPPFYVSGFEASYDDRLVQSPSAPGPADSAVKAIEAGIQYPILLTTADHALLDADMLCSFLQQAQIIEADFCVGLATKAVIQPAYPDVKRTYLKFRDQSVSGCNLFYLANENGLKAIHFWKRAQNFRKQPVRLAASIGLMMPFLYLTGRLTLDKAFEYVSRRLGINAKPVIIPIAEAAIDVDKPSDLELVEAILAKRNT